MVTFNMHNNRNQIYEEETAHGPIQTCQFYNIIIIIRLLYIV